MEYSRRDFLKQAGKATIAIIGVILYPSCAHNPYNAKTNTARIRTSKTKQNFSETSTDILGIDGEEYLVIPWSQEGIPNEYTPYVDGANKKLDERIALPWAFVPLRDSLEERTHTGVRYSSKNGVYFAVNYLSTPSGVKFLSNRRTPIDLKIPYKYPEAETEWKKHKEGQLGSLTNPPVEEDFQRFSFKDPENKDDNKKPYIIVKVPGEEFYAHCVIKRPNIIKEKDIKVEALPEVLFSPFDPKENLRLKTSRTGDCGNIERFWKWRGHAYALIKGRKVKNTENDEDDIIAHLL